MADAQRRDAAWIAVEAAERQQRVGHAQLEPGIDRRRLELGVEPIDDLVQRHDLARRVQGEELIGQVAAALEDGKARAQRVTSRYVAVVVAREMDVLVIDRHDAGLIAARLLATERAAEDLALGHVAACFPDVLLDDCRTAARRAACREALLDQALELDLAARVGSYDRQAGVEVAQVRRAQDDLGEEPRERGRLAGVDPAQSADRAARDPAAAAVDVDHDVARRGAGRELGRDHVVGRRRGEALEGG